MTDLFTAAKTALALYLGRARELYGDALQVPIIGSSHLQFKMRLESDFLRFLSTNLRSWGREAWQRLGKEACLPRT